MSRSTKYLKIFAFVYLIFLCVGLEASTAGIASEAALVLIVIVWTGSYLFRVVTGQMTFMEQRRRYRQAYEKLTEAELEERFDSLSDDEKSRLIEQLDAEDNLP